jgi:hypothetical protein
LRHADDGAPRQAKFLEGVETENAGAVYRRADMSVLLEHDDVDAARRETARGQESRRAGADYDHITFRNPTITL